MRVCVFPTYCRLLTANNGYQVEWEFFNQRIAVIAIHLPDLLSHTPELIGNRLGSSGDWDVFLK